MKLLLIFALFISVPCCSQKYRLPEEPITYNERNPLFTLMLPNAGLYSARPTDLTKWIQSNGGNAGKISYGGDFFNFTGCTDSNWIFGLSAGGLYSSASTPNQRLGYGELLVGRSVYANEIVQFNVVGHATCLGYTVIGIVPPNVPQPPSDYFYMRGTTFGGGLSIQAFFTLKRYRKSSLGLGIDGGASLIDPTPFWKFGYDAYSAQSGKYIFRGTRISGPDVDQAIGYIRFSLLFRFDVH